VKIENRQQFLIILTFVAIGLFVGVNFILTPLAGWWSGRSAQIRDLSAKVKDGRYLIQREVAIRNHWEDMRANALPANTSLAEHQLLNAVDGWSQSSGVEITSMMPQWKNDDTNYMTLDLRVETSGDISMLSQFLYDIENSPAALRVDSVELGAHDNTGQLLTLSLEINGLALLPPSQP